MNDRVEGLTHLGMGRLSDGTLVPRVLPGEVIERDGDAVRIVTPSADRVAAPCRHYRTCGGCAVQHASDDFVAHWKQDIVARALGARGLEASFQPMHTSPQKSRRRAKFAGKRTKKGALVGFHGRASDMVISVPECQVVTPALVALLPALETLTPQVTSRKAEVSFTVTETPAGHDLLIETTQALTPELRSTLAAFAETHGLARLTWVDEPVVTRHPPALRFGQADVVPPPGSFLQATRDGEAALLAPVRKIVGDARRVVDLFAGCGTFALPLAETAEVLAVEGEAAMLDALDRGWRTATGLKRVECLTRDLFRRPLEPDELRFDAAVIDPPRAGAEAQIGRLAQSDIPIIAMVSCNPVTFARDAQTLVEAGYVMGRVQVVDQFRWSTHVEMVGGFTRL